MSHLDGSVLSAKLTKLWFVSCIWYATAGILANIHLINLLYSGWNQLIVINWRVHIGGLMQGRHNSIADALELHLSCTNPSTWSKSLIKWCIMLWNANTAMLSYWISLSNLFTNYSPGRLNNPWTGARFYNEYSTGKSVMWLWLPSTKLVMLVTPVLLAMGVVMVVRCEDCQFSSL